MKHELLSQSLAKEMVLVRERKIQLLRKKIAQGKYQVKNKLIAKALAPPRSH